MRRSLNPISSRPPCGGADRNGRGWDRREGVVVAPRAGARIETLAL